MPYLATKLKEIMSYCSNPSKISHSDIKSSLSVVFIYSPNLLLWATLKIYGVYAAIKIYHILCRWIEL